MEKLKIAQYIALGATALSVIGFILGGMVGLGFGFGLMGLGCIVGIVAYVFGGFGTAVRIAASIAKWGWLVVPFPADIATFAIAFVVSVYVFLFLPIIPIRKAYNESNKY